MRLHVSDYVSLQTGERPFVCPQEDCEKAFREKGNLLTHMRTHNLNQEIDECDSEDRPKRPHKHMCDM